VAEAAGADRAAAVVADRLAVVVDHEAAAAVSEIPRAVGLLVYCNTVL
jgi:hypothetical protein